MAKIQPILTKIAIVLASLLFVLIVYSLIKSTPERYYSKAARMHKLGEKRYLRGNHESAQQAYDRADEFRKMARELQ